MRPQIQIKILKEYSDNESKGLCRVCGKSKDKFDKGRRLFCSQNCADKYQECFVSWNKIREEMLKEYPYCNNCTSDIGLEVDHIKPYALGGKMWDKDNLQVLCYECHKEKTKLDIKKIAELRAIKKNQKVNNQLNSDGNTI